MYVLVCGGGVGGGGRGIEGISARLSKPFAAMRLSQLLLNFEHLVELSAQEWELLWG